LRLAFLATQFTRQTPFCWKTNAPLDDPSWFRDDALCLQWIAEPANLDRSQRWDHGTHALRAQAERFHQCSRVSWAKALSRSIEPFPINVLATGRQNALLGKVKWEYKLLRLDAASEPVELDEAMNSVGEFAWELAGIMHHAGEEEDSYYTAVFKRPKQT